MTSDLLKWKNKLLAMKITIYTNSFHIYWALKASLSCVITVNQPGALFLKWHALSVSVHPHLIFPLFSSWRRFSPSLAIPNEALCVLHVCFVCGIYVCVHYWMHWPVNGCGCLIALPWIQLDVNLKNSIMSCLSLWKILNKKILRPISRLITLINRDGKRGWHSPFIHSLEWL